MLSNMSALHLHIFILSDGYKKRNLSCEYNFSMDAREFSLNVPLWHATWKSCIQRHATTINECKNDQCVSHRFIDRIVQFHVPPQKQHQKRSAADSQLLDSKSRFTAQCTWKSHTTGTRNEEKYPTRTAEKQRTIAELSIQNEQREKREKMLVPIKETRR